MFRYADLVIINGRLFDTKINGENQEALAVIANRITFVGANGDIREWIGQNTQVIDARWNSVLPGFIDSHVHFSSGGFGLTGIQLRDTNTPDDVCQ